MNEPTDLPLEQDWELQRFVRVIKELSREELEELLTKLYKQMLWRELQIREMLGK